MLLAPAGLAALAAVLLPLLIHLARRSEERPTDFAALRWLQPKPRPRKRPRLDERVLLAVRLALLALLALWLAQPVLTGAADRTAWVAVMPGVEAARATSLITAGAHGAWLAPGFPPLDTPAPTGPIQTASLVRELDASLPPDAALTVLVPPVIASADAERPRVARPVTWRIVPGRVAPATPPPPAPLTFAIRAAPGVTGVGYLRAAATALLPAGGTIDIAPTSTPLPASGVVAWWATGALPPAVRDWAERGGTVLLPTGAILPTGAETTVWRDTVSAPLADGVAVGRGRIIRFTQPLTPAAMPVLLDARFPDALAALIVAPLAPPGRVRAQDYAPELGAPRPGNVAATLAVQPWLALLLAALFLAERWLATRRRRAATP